MQIQRSEGKSSFVLMCFWEEFRVLVDTMLHRVNKKLSRCVRISPIVDVIYFCGKRNEVSRPRLLYSNESSKEIIRVRDRDLVAPP